MHEQQELHGRYGIECFDRDGALKWSEDFDNVVCTGGKSLMLDAGLSGNGYIVNGPYMGLITAAGYSSVNQADAMNSHAGWAEATSYSAPRKLTVFGSAVSGSKTTPSPIQFAFTTTDTIRGAFLVYGPGAVSTIGSTTGVLYSAGVLGSDRAVVNGDTVNITYVASL